MGGARKTTRSNTSSTGSHVWIINGYHRTSQKTVYANMGWNGSSNGWYQISTDLHFTTDNGDYATKFWKISELRKK